MRARVALFALLLLLCQATSAQMTWQVVNRFPLFSDAAFQRLLEEVDGSAADLEVKLTQVDYRHKVRHLDRAGAWNPDTRKYDAERLLSSQAKVVGRSSIAGECTWTLATEMGVATEVQNSSSSCMESPQFSVVIGEAYTLTAQSRGGGVPESARVVVKKHLAVAMGDSFASGEGNPDYPAVINPSLLRQPPDSWAVDPEYPAARIVKSSAEWLDVECHRSLLSWPSLYSLREAIKRADTVVQFASFACSGAEVLDGFILKQRNPPGHVGVKPSGKDTFVERSQQRALAMLLCHGQPIDNSSQYAPSSLEDYMEKYRDKYAKFEIYRCEKPVKPDEIFVQFGGNDTGFAGVVKYVFHPKLKYRGFLVAPFLTSFVGYGLYKGLAPIEPLQTTPYLQQLPEVYDWLHRGLDALGVQPGTVRMVQYPDPGVTAVETADEVAELKSCNARTRDANVPVQHLIAHQLNFLFLRHDSAFYGVSPAKLSEVRASYVPNLQSAQSAAARSHKWGLIVSNPAFKGRGVCAGSLECDRLGDACPMGDRVRWAYRSANDKLVHAKQSPSWGDISEFRPYALDRQRGLRYANDALLAQARLDGKTGKVRLDWVTGIAHPTAELHARIAARISFPN